MALPAQGKRATVAVVVTCVGTINGVASLNDAGSTTRFAVQRGWAFRTPGEAAYCRVESAARSLAVDAFRCVTPNDGFWIRISGVDSGNVRIAKGYDRRWRGFRDHSAPVLAFGRDWLSSDAALFICESRSSGLTCRHYDGLTFWLGRYHGYRIYRGPPGLAPQVQPFFRTAQGVWCGLSTGGGADPAYAVLSCWRASDGTTLSLSHADEDRGAGIGRNARARGYRPGGFPLLRPGRTFVWRCRQVTPEWADRCAATGPGTAIFTCRATASDVRCTNRFGRGFVVGLREAKPAPRG